MADPTVEMTQRAAAYVPEGLRPDGWKERLGWYGDKLWQKPSKEQQYDTEPFGYWSSGADQTMEQMLYKLLFGNATQEATQKVDEDKKRREAEERKRRTGGWVSDPNVDSNRFGTQGEFNRY